MKIDETIAKKVLDTVDCGLSHGIGQPIPGQMCVEAAVCYALDLPHGDNPSCVALSLRDLKIRLNDSYWSSDKARAVGLRRLALAQLGSKDELDETMFAQRVATLAIKVYVPIALMAAAKLQKDTKHRHALEAAASNCEKIPTQAAASDAADAASDAARAAAARAAAAADAADAAAARVAAARVAAAAAASANAAAARVAAARAAAYAASYAADAAAYAAARAAADAASYAADAAAYAAARAAARDKTLASFAEDVVQILIEMKAPGCQWLYLTETNNEVQA